MELQNIDNYEPFVIVSKELNDETIQVDVYGAGAINYFELLNDELKLEINTNINIALREYTEVTGHDSSEIGYCLSFQPSTKLNRNTNTIQTSVAISIVFHKPVPTATLYQLQPTVELITSTILGEIFILQNVC